MLVNANLDRLRRRREHTGSRGGTMGWRLAHVYAPEGAGMTLTTYDVRRTTGSRRRPTVD